MLRSDDQEFIRDLLNRRSGIVYRDDQAHLVESRLTSLARAKSLSGPDALIASLRLQPQEELIASVIDALTTHETSFFRDHRAFAALSERVIPDLVANRRQKRTLAIWSAGCSTGQEPYSLALLLREQFPELEQWRVRLWATDVSSLSLKRAREGLFSELELKRGLSERVRNKYFKQAGGLFRIDDGIRRMVTWETMNLTADWPPLGCFDLILMRNVLIYFSPASRATIFAQIARHLADDGDLMLGTSETTFGLSVDFDRYVVNGATLYRKAEQPNELGRYLGTRTR